MADHPSALSTDENTLLQAALETPFSTSSSDTIPPQTTSSVPHSALSPSQLDPEPHTHHDESTETLQFDQQSSIETLTEIHDDGSVLMEQTSSDEQPEVGWESVGEKAGATASKGTSSDTSLWPTPAESTEAESQVKSQTPTPTFPYSTPETDSQRWEDVPSSMASSFPSMSFPERTTSPSPEPTKPTPDPPAISATTAIFDPSLSKRVRLSAFLSSLAINLLLPFVNGVMLGFGEIFAKNVIVNWFGWKQTTIKRKGISDVGIGAPLPSEQRKRSSRYNTYRTPLLMAQNPLILRTIYLITGHNGCGLLCEAETTITSRYKPKPGILTKVQHIELLFVAAENSHSHYALLSL